MATASLTTIPPELLLQIISHLPTSSYFLSLSQTSHYLRSFLSTHVKTICSTRIMTHYHEAASILRSEHSTNGWLIPTHPCTMPEDEQIHSFYQPMLYGEQVCSNCDGRSKRIYHRYAHGFHQYQQPQKLFSCFPLPWTHPPLSHIRQSSSSSLCNSEARVNLAIRGMLYLLFLEKYGADIIRMNMMHSAITASLPDGKKINNAFELHVRTFCVARFLRDAKREMRNLEERMSAPVLVLGTPNHSFSDDSSKEFHDGHNKEIKIWRSLKTKMRACLARRKETTHQQNRHGYNRIENEPRLSTAKRPLLFGEIERSQAESQAPSWKRGLIWYHPIIESDGTMKKACSSVTVNEIDSEPDLDSFSKNTITSSTVDTEDEELQGKTRMSRAKQGKAAATKRRLQFVWKKVVNVCNRDAKKPITETT